MSDQTRNPRTIRIAVGAASGLVLVAVSWLVLIGPQRSAAAQVRAQTQTVVSQNQLTALHNQSLAQQSKGLPALQSKLRAALTALPSGSGLPELTRDLTNFASSCSVTLAEIDVGAVSPVVAPAPIVTPSTDGNVTDAPSTAVSSTGEYAIPVTVTVNGSATKLTAFLARIETGSRGAVVGSAQITDSATARIASVDTNSTLTVQLTVYSAPLSGADLAGINRLLTASR